MIFTELLLYDWTYFSKKTENQVMSSQQFLVTFLSLPAIALGAMPTLASTANTASAIDISCQIQNGTPSLVATFPERNTRANVTMLRFLGQYFSADNAWQACQNTAKNLQTLYNSGSVNYLTSGKLDLKSVICNVERRGMGCDSSKAKILFSLDRQVEPSLALYQMLGDRFKPSQPLDNRTVSRIYTDIKIKSHWWEFWQR